MTEYASLDLHDVVPKGRSATRDQSDGVYLIRADQIVPEEVEYLDEPTIPLRVVTLVVGLDGVGKSTMLYERAARATRGQLQGIFHGEPVDVVIASSEDHPGSVILPRLVAAGADLTRVHVVRVHRDGLTGDIALPDDLDAMAEQVKRVNAGLLIVDPLVAHMPMNIDTHKAQHVRRVLAPLARLAEEARLAVACVVHFNGAASTDVRSRISGSKALRDASRSVLVCGVDPGDETRFVMVQDKNSFGPKPTTGRAFKITGEHVTIAGKRFATSAITWLGEVEVDSRGLLAGPGDPEEQTDCDEAVSLLTRLVESNGGRVAASDAIKAGAELGVSSKTMQRARRQIGLTVEREGFGKGSICWWQMPGSFIVDNETESDVAPDPVQYGEALMPEGKAPVPSSIVDRAQSLSTMEDGSPSAAELAEAWHEDRGTHALTYDEGLDLLLDTFPAAEIEDEEVPL